ncbi:MAG: tetratricopeptide repeat protein [Spirochaetota bacterium]
MKIDEIIPEQQGKISDKGEGVDEGVELKKEGKKITEKVPVVSEKATKVPEQLKPLQKAQATLDEPKTLQRAQETLNEPKTLKKDQETLDEPGPVQEEKIREQDTVLKKESKATAEESSLSHGKNKKLAKKSTELPDKGKKPHIYYTDENKRRVKVPFRSEDDDFLEAVELYGKNQLQEAVSKLEHYLEDCTGCRYQNEAKMKIAQIYMDMGQTQKSLGYLDEIINGNSGKYAAQAYQKKADIMYAEGKYEEALHSYTKAYGYTDALDILKKIGDIHFQLEQYEKAAEVYQKALHAGMKNDMMVFRLASIYDTPGKMRDIEKAYNYYEDLLDEYETSKYQGIAKERINFFNKNFYNYK